MQIELNPQQLKAVHHLEGPALVLAGAGSGKTRVIVSRICYLLEMGVPSSEILAVTFTNKAALEMRRRIEGASHAFVLTCTFHSLCARILRESIAHLGYHSYFTIYDEQDSEKVLKDCFSSKDKSALKRMRQQISIAKNRLEEPTDPLVRSVFTAYQARLKESSAVDFDDLLYLTVRLFQTYPTVLELYQKRWAFILVDEYQDTNEAQHQLVQLLGAAHQNIFGVGDPDQSIYSWRGACLNNILHFQNDFPGTAVILLEQNYRSTATILNASNALISHNQNRLPKNLWSQRGVGEKIFLQICEDEKSEAAFVSRNLLKQRQTPLSECAILYRTNFQSRALEDALIKARIPYIIVGGLSFYERKEIKDMLAYLKTAFMGMDFLAFARSVNTPKRRFGEAAAEKIREASLKTGLSLIETCHRAIHEPIGLSKVQIQGLKEYLQVLSSIESMAERKEPLTKILEHLITQTDYLTYLKEDPETYEDRKSNLAELVAKAAEWEIDAGQSNIHLFLEELVLQTAPAQNKNHADSVHLMTLHHGKGLEFSTVFLVGMEEGLLPLTNGEEEGDLEEERRLCYVGMTRAKNHLYLSTCKRRFLWGMPRLMKPSRFLTEIPPEYLQASHPLSTEPRDGFQIGDSVHHRDFGRGVIRKQYQTSLGLTYDIFFPDLNIERTIVAKFAKLS